ncbi:hypothetical protein ACTQW9_10680 [Lachnospiraceae bacterium LCP19S3_B12]
MKRKNRELQGLALCSLCLALALPVYADNRELIKTERYTIQAKEGAYERNELFPETVTEDGKAWQLTDVTYEVEDTRPVTEEETMEQIVTSDPVPASEDLRPPEHFTKDEILWELTDVSYTDTLLREAHTQAVEAQETYEPGIEPETILQTKDVTVTDEVTGEEITVSCDLYRVEESGRQTVYNTLPLVFYEYDAGGYLFAGQIIVPNDQAPALAGYETALLEEAGYDPAVWTVTGYSWSGEPYYLDGQLIREGSASIQSRQPVYTAYYSGSIQTEEEKGVYYTAAYIGIKKQEIPGQMEYTVLATAHYARVTENVWKSLVIGLGVVVLAVLAILILYILAKKRRERGRKTEWINLRRT